MTYYPQKDYYVGKQSRLPEVVVTGKKPYKWVSARTPQLTLGDVVKGVHTATNPLFAWTSPSQYVGAIRDSHNPAEFITSMMRGNSGFFTEKYVLEHPIISTVVNTAVDVATPVGGVKTVSKADDVYRAVKSIISKNVSSSKINWNADTWFKKISGRNSYSKEEAAELASHVPEYREIEKRLFNEGKLVKNSDGSISVIGENMSPQEYIMRQSEAFQKMNPEHHYVGVKNKFRNNFENGSRDPNTKNRYEVWTDRKSPENVEEYAYSGFGGNTVDSKIKMLQNTLMKKKAKYEADARNLKEELKSGKITKEEYDLKYKQFMERYSKEIERSQYVLDKTIKQKEIDPLNGGKIYDVTYPKDAVEPAIIDAEGAHWESIPFNNVLKAEPNIVSHYTQRGVTPYDNTLQTDQIVSAAKRNGYGVTHIDNVMDTYNGTLLNETIIGDHTPIKSVLGNTGSFNLKGPNKWKLYRSIALPLVGAGTFFGLSNNNALGGK